MTRKYFKRYYMPQNDFGDVGVAGDAAAALSETVPYERGEQAVETPAPVVEQTPQVQQPVQQPVVDNLDSLPTPDLSSLNPEARAAAEAAIRGFQATFTQKTQAIAPIRQLADQVGGVDRVQQIVDFYQRLDTDRDFARQVYDQLGNALGNDGQQAQQPVPAQPQAPVESPSNEFDINDLPPDIAAAVKYVQEQKNEISTTLARQQQAQEEQQILAQYTRDEQAILTANPHYTEQDMNYIYKLAYENGGDLNRAHADYQAAEQHMLARYLANKQAAPTPTPVPGARGEVTQNQLSADQRRAAAIEMIRNDMDR